MAWVHPQDKLDFVCRMKNAIGFGVSTGWHGSLATHNDDAWLNVNVSCDAASRTESITICGAGLMDSHKPHSPENWCILGAWTGKDTKARVKSFFYRSHLGRRLVDLDSMPVEAHGKYRTRFRFYISMDASVLKHITGLSPPNCYTRSPLKEPCFWCTRTHREIRSWPLQQTTGDTLRRRVTPTSCLIQLPVDRFVPDYLLHGNRNLTRRLLDASVLFLAKVGLVRDSMVVANSLLAANAQQGWPGHISLVSLNRYPTFS